MPDLKRQRSTPTLDPDIDDTRQSPSREKLDQKKHVQNYDEKEPIKEIAIQEYSPSTEKGVESGLTEPIYEVRDGILDERDPELGAENESDKKSIRSSEQDPNLVSWESEQDPENPKNWTMKRKWAAVTVVSMFTFISPVASTMVAPSIATIAKDFDIKDKFEQQFMLSIFLLAYAVGPLFLGPLSEVYGRIPVLQLSNLFFLAWNTGCGFAKTKQQMLAFRFLSGLGGSAPLAIGGGVLSDVFYPEQRGRAVGIYSLMPLLSPAISPVAAGFITENTTWRWSFWATSIACVLIQLVGLFLLRETYPPILLGRKAAKLRKETGNNALHTEFERPDRSLRSIIATACTRPFRLLVTQPIVMVLALYMAYLYGILYLVFSTFPELWTKRYNERIGIGGLNYISIGLGFLIATQTTAPLNDAIYVRLKKRNNNIGRPEFRIPLMIPAAIIYPIGLLWYGWAAQAKVHWIVPNIGIAIHAAGGVVGFQSIQTYLVDTYTRYAASAVAATTVLRSLAGCAFPLFAPYVYEALDYGWGNTLLALIAFAIGIPAPFLLWKYGPALRASSQFAAG